MNTFKSIDELLKEKDQSDTRAVAKREAEPTPEGSAQPAPENKAGFQPAEPQPEIKSQ